MNNKIIMGVIMKNSKKILSVLLILLLMFASVLTGCSKKTTDVIHFGITMGPGSIRTAIVILADKLGYFAEEGVKVDFTEVADAASALTSLSLGKGDLDIWGTGIVPDLTFITNGSDLVIFEGTAAEGGAIISLPENVEKYKDLTNFEKKTVAMVRNQTSWVVTRELMRESGIDVNSINLKYVDSQINVAQAVAKGEADIGFLPVEFANQFRPEGIELVREVGELVPNYVCCRQITSRKTFESKRDALVKFSKANIRAWNYFENPANRENVINLLSEFSGQQGSYINQYFFVNHTLLTLDPNTKGIKNFYTAMINSDYFTGKTPVEIENHIDSSIYKEALDAVAAKYPNEEFYQTALKNFEIYN